MGDDGTVGSDREEIRAVVSRLVPEFHDRAVEAEQLRTMPAHIVEWRPARDVGVIKELAPKSRPAARTPEQVELERLRRRNERLEGELAKHKLALEIQGKASELLERLLAESDETKRQR